MVNIEQNPKRLAASLISTITVFYFLSFALPGGSKNPGLFLLWITYLCSRAGLLRLRGSLFSPTPSVGRLSILETFGFWGKQIRKFVRNYAAATAKK
jgi:hypothetical protein